MYIAIANAIYSSLLQGSRGGFPQACFGLDYNAITSDFTFTRNSFATRVNEFGLIETVTNLGSNLVQNGNFEELGPEQVSNGNFALGSEKITNGNFDDGENDWTLGSGWSIEDGKAECSGNASHSYLLQSESFTSGVTYKITFDIVVDSGSFEVQLLGSGNDRSGVITSSQTEYTVYIKPSANRNSFGIRSNDGNGIGSIDNVSVKEVTDWSLGSSWSVLDEKATSDGSASNLDQSGTFLSGKTYKVTYDVLDYISGDIRFRFTGTSNENGTLRNSNGTYTEYITLTNNQSVLRFPSSAFNGSITNVSVKQVDPNDEWSKDTGWSIANGIATCDGTSGSSIYQNIGGVLDTVYKIEVTISNYVSGTLQIGGSSNFLPASANGTFTHYRTWTSDPTLYLKSKSGDGFNGSIDNVSVEEVLTDDIPRIDFTGSTFDVPVYGDELLTDGAISNLGGGSFTFTSNGLKAISDGTSGSALRPRLLWSSLTVGKQYRIIGTPTVNSGNTNYSLYNGSSYEKDLVAVESFDITFTCGGSNVFFTNNGTQAFDIDWDLSIKEVIGYTTDDKGAFLLEPISTNLIAYSEDISGSSNWGASSVATTTDVATSPDGTQNADLIQSIGSSSCFISDSNLTFTVGNTYSFSVFAKKGNNDWIRTAHVSSAINASWFDLENGVVGTVNGVSGTIEDYGNGWYRCTNTFVATQSSGGNQVFIGICDSDGSTNAGVSGQNNYVWGMQVEALPYATSYIPTNGTTVTRAQETCVDATPTINSEEGVLYAEFNVFDSLATYKMIEINDGTGNNRVVLYTYSGNIYGFVKSNGTTNLNVFSVETVTDFNKVAIKWGTDETALWVNGVEANTGSGSTFNVGVLDDLNFLGAGTQYFYGRTKDLKVYCKALTDEQLIELTTI